MPVFAGLEEFGYVDVAQYVVDFTLVNEYFAAAGGGKKSRELRGGGVVDVHGHNLVARRHAVAQVSRGEIDGVAE